MAIVVTGRTKEKNLYIYTTDRPGKNYIFDVNTGSFTGLTNKELVKVPAPVLSYIQQHQQANRTNIEAYLFHRYYGTTQPLISNPITFSTLDRLDSLNIKACSLYEKNIAAVAENFKPFIQWQKEHSGDYYMGMVSLSDFACYIEEKKFVEPITKLVSEDCDPDLFNIIKQYIRNKELTPDKPEFGLAIYFIEKYLSYSCINTRDTRYDRETGKMIVCYDSYEIYRLLNEIFDLAKVYNVKLEKGDFFKQYIPLKKEFLVKSTFTDNERLKTVMERKRDKLAFEYGDYKVVLLDTVEKLCDESKQQSNCVASAYIKKMVRGFEYIVAVRHKDNLDKSLVTCEVHQDGTIGQFYKALNCCVKDNDLLEFKYAYGKHLKNVWGNK